MEKKEIIEKYIKIAEEYGIEKKEKPKKTEEKTEEKPEEKKPEAEYKLIFSDDRDFIIEKKKGGKTEQLVFLYPQFFIRRSNGIAVQITIPLVRGFFKQGSIPINNNLITTANVQNITSLIDYLKRPYYAEFFEERKASLVFFNNIADCSIMDPKISDMAFLMMIADYHQVLVGGEKYNEQFLALSYQIYKLSQNLFDVFMEKYIRSSMIGVEFSVNRSTGYGHPWVYLSDLYEKYGDRFLDYFLFELYRQGYDRVPFNHYSLFWKNRDFLKTEIDFPEDLSKTIRAIEICERRVNSCLNGARSLKKVNGRSLYISRPKSIDEVLKVFSKMSFFLPNGRFSFVRDQKTDEVVYILWTLYDTKTFKKEDGVADEEETKELKTSFGL